MFQSVNTGTGSLLDAAGTGEGRSLDSQFYPAGKRALRRLGYLLAFSCKRRGFCPSCHQRKVRATAATLFGSRRQVPTTSCAIA